MAPWALPVHYLSRAVKVPPGAPPGTKLALYGRSQRIPMRLRLYHGRLVSAWTYLWTWDWQVKGVNQ
jgi:hypothetical protein